MAEPTHIQSGYLYGDTVVTNITTSKNIPLVLIIGQYSYNTNSNLSAANITPTHKDSTGTTTLNTFTNFTSYYGGGTVGLANIKFWITSSKYPITFGDRISLPGNTSIPVFWALWQLNGCDAFSGTTATGVGPYLLSGTQFTAQLQANTDTWQRKGTLIGCAFGDNASAQAAPLPFSLSGWTPGGGGETASDNGPQHVVDSTNQFYFKTVGKEATTKASNWIANFNFTKSTTDIPGSGICSYVRIMPWRTEDAQKTKPVVAAVTRSTRY